MYGLTLEEIESLLSKKFQEAEIISDISLEYDIFIYLESLIKKKLDAINDGYTLELMLYRYKLSISTIMVYEALYKYRKSYWDNVISLVPSGVICESIIKECFVNVFNKVVREYSLKKFDDVGGYKNVTPIICHSGIPNSSLKTLYDVTSQFIVDDDVSPEEIIDNIKYFIRYKVDKSIYRFITKNEDRAKDFIYDLQILIRDSEKYSYTDDDITSKYSHLEKRVIDEFIEYRKEVESNTESKNKKKKYLTQPKLIFDKVKKSIMILLPRNIIVNGYDDKAEWVIYTDSNKRSVEVELYENGVECYTQEMKVALLPATHYKVEFQYEGKCLGSWDYSGFTNDEPYILFDSNNNLIKSNRTSESNIYIILKNECKLKCENINIHEFSIQEKGWIDFLGVEVKFTKKIQEINVYLNNKECGKIEFRDKNTIMLTGGNVIFGDEIKEGYVPIYSITPPKIKFDRTILLDESFYLSIRNLKNNINTNILIRDIFEERTLEVNLENIKCFEDKVYGEYDLRIYSGKRLIKILPLKFVPYVKIENITQDVYPNIKGAYKKHTFTVTSDKNIVTSFNDCEDKLIDNIYRNKSEFSYHGSEHFINGNLEFDYEENLYNFPIKMKSRSVSYDIFDEGNQIEFKKSTIKLYTKELLNANKTIAISFKDIFTEEVDIILSLEDAEGNTLQQINDKCFKNKTLFVSMNRFYDSVLNVESIRYSIKVSIEDRYGRKINEFYICTIKEEVLISDVIYSQLDNNNISLSWRQEGVAVENSIKLEIYDILQPWEQPLEIDIVTEDLVTQGKRNTIYINSQEFVLKDNAIYYFHLQLEEEEFFDEERELNIIKFKKEALCNLCDPLESVINYGDDVKSLIAAIIKFNDVDRLSKIFIQISKKDFGKREYDERIVKGLYFLYINIKELIKGNNKDEKKYKLNCIYRLCEKYFNSLNVYDLLDGLFKIDGYKNIKSLLDKIKIVSLEREKEAILEKEEREKLWEVDSERAFLVETRSGITSKSISIKKIYEFVGEDIDKKILGYSIECDSCRYKGNRGCVSQFIKRRCDKRSVCLSENLIGSNDIYQTLFMKYNTKFNSKELESLTWLDESDDGIKLFGETYVSTLLNWVLKVELKERKELSKQIENSIPILNNIVSYLKNISCFNDMNELLIKRKDITNKSNPGTLAYYCGLTVLVTSMFRYNRTSYYLNKNEINEVMKLLNFFRKNMYEIYLRDLVIIEFYLMQGEKLYVDGSN